MTARSLTRAERAHLKECRQSLSFVHAELTFVAWCSDADSGNRAAREWLERTRKARDDMERDMETRPRLYDWEVDGE